MLVLSRVRRPRLSDRWPEACLLAVVVVLAGTFSTRSSLSMIYLVFPVIIWAALRFQLPGSAPCALVVSVLAITAGTDALGPFAGHTLMEIMANLTVLNGCVALTALLLGAIVAEHQEHPSGDGVRRRGAGGAGGAARTAVGSARGAVRRPPGRHGPLDGGPLPDHG
ncbi:hypothetical protein SVIOM74S_08006 [Streptomyces violarus]